MSAMCTGDILCFSFFYFLILFILFLILILYVLITGKPSVLQLQWTTIEKEASGGLTVFILIQGLSPLPNPHASNSSYPQPPLQVS